MFRMQQRTFVIALALAAVLPAGAAAQDTPTPAPAPAAMAEPRGWFGLSLSCEECLVQRGAGQIAYSRLPRVYTVESRSPAAIAGIRNGDTLVAVDGLSLLTPEGYARFAMARPGVPLRLTVRRSGEARDVTLTPAERSNATTIADYYRTRAVIAQRRGLEALRTAFRTPMGWLGMSLECEGCSLSRMTASFRSPPAVAMVDVESPAARAGLRRGDTLIAVDGADITTREGGRAFAAIEPEQRINLTVRRDGRERRVAVTAIMRPDAQPQEIAAYNEYRRTRDSADAQFRALVSANVAQVTSELREFERALREMEAQRMSVDQVRRELSSVDSVLRTLRSVERERSRMGGFTFTFPADIDVRITPPAVAVAPMAPMPPDAPYPGVAPRGPRPLRYSGRIGDVNVEARAPGPVSTNVFGDSLVVINYAGAEIRVSLRPSGSRR